MIAAARAVVLAAIAVACFSAVAQTQNPDLCSAEQPSQCLNGVSASVTALDALRSGFAGGRDGADEEERERRKKKPQRVALASNGSTAGLLAADEASGWAAWVGYGRPKFEGKVDVAPYTADQDAFRFGVDKALSARSAFGVALLVDRLETRTKFNGGGQDVDTEAIAPYFTWAPNDAMSIDINGGVGRSSASQDRIDPLSVPGSPLILTSNYDADRTFGSITVNWGTTSGAWLLSARGGFLSSREEQDGYVEAGGPSIRTVGTRKLKLDQAFAGGEAAYLFANAWEAYAAGLYRYDTKRDDGGTAGGLPSAVGSTQPDDRDEFEWIVGLRFFGQKGLTLSAEYVSVSGREKFEYRSFNLLVRYAF